MCYLVVNSTEVSKTLLSMLMYYNASEFLREFRMSKQFTVQPYTEVMDDGEMATSFKK